MRERRLAVLQFSIILTASALMGIIFARYFISGIFVARNSSVAVRYFDNVFLHSVDVSDHLLYIISVSYPEIASVVAITFSAWSRPIRTSMRESTRRTIRGIIALAACARLRTSGSSSERES